jgi:hypothetical protein
LLIPGLVFALGSYWAAIAAWRSTFAILARDQGGFQYAAWAIANGERAYADFRYIDGPLAHVLHLAAMTLGGADEHRFRILDLVASSSVFLASGALLPGIAHRAGTARPATTASTRVMWALAAWVVLMSQYVMYGWSYTVQRESFFNLFLISSIALQLYAQQPRAPGEARVSERWVLALAGALSAATWFGKPTCVLYTAVQALAIVVDDEAPLTRWKGVLSFAIGGAAAALTMIGLVVVTGDLAAFVRIQFGDVPRVYRFIWNSSIADCYQVRGSARLNRAFATVVFAIALIGAGWLPRRFLAILALPTCGLFLYFFQRKCFPYHMHPVTAGTHLVWLGLLVWGTERAVASRWRASAVGAAAAAVLLGAVCRIETSNSGAAQNRWNEIGATPEARAGEAYVRDFASGDFFPWDLRQAGAFLREHTKPDDRVQTYGTDPYLLFFARRKSATPFIYAFELNADAAIAGGSGARPDAQERTWLLETAKKHEAEMLTLLQTRPPAAFALIDRAPFSHPVDAVVDFERHCPNAAAFMHERYRPAARFGAVHVWLRNDFSAAP